MAYKEVSRIRENQGCHIFAVCVLHGYYCSRHMSCAVSGLCLSYLYAYLTVLRKDMLKYDKWPNCETGWDKKQRTRANWRLKT